MQATIYNNICPQPTPEEGFKRICRFRNEISQKNILNGLRNAQKILNDLEQSLQKTKEYEKKLMKCKASHSHLHSVNEWWDSDISEDDKSKSSKTGTSKPSRSQVNLADSWSTMSIVCLQYQYEELSKRYSSLLEAYNERSSSLSSREAALSRLRKHVRGAHARLDHANRAMIMIGEKYLSLRDKRLAQKMEYEQKIARLSRSVSEVMTAAERARLELNEQLAESMCAEQDAATALLLDEIRKCNLLVLENLKLKAQLEKLIPGNVNWNT